MLVWEKGVQSPGQLGVRCEEAVSYLFLCLGPEEMAGPVQRERNEWQKWHNCYRPRLPHQHSAANTALASCENLGSPSWGIGLITGFTMEGKVLWEEWHLKERLDAWKTIAVGK